MAVASRNRILALGAVLALAAAAAYTNTFRVPFLFDDEPAIQENASIRNAADLGRVLSPPGGGNPVAGRPLVNLTFALNHAADGLEVRGYHAVNLLVHIGAGLLLFGIVRRTCARDGMPEWMRDRALPAGFFTALFWLLHPLQTEAVTYLVQRTESLAGLLYLLALYGFIRGSDGSPGGRGWLGLAVAACWLGMAAKETMATAPLVVWLYDRTFVAGSFRDTWARRGFYAGLAASWLLLAMLMLGTGGRGGTAVWDEQATAWRSLLTQARAIAGYLRLAFWPDALVFDYGDFPGDMAWDFSAVWPQFLLVAGLAVATIVALWRWPRIGFLGASFFLILAPSSSFIPIVTQLRAEHRMYLPLAAVIIGVVLALGRLARRDALIVGVGLALALGVTTFARNGVYQSALGLWADTVLKHPGNARAHHNHGLELFRAGDGTGAILEYKRALALEPKYFDAHLNLAQILMKQGDSAEGLIHLNAAAALQPRTSNDCNNMSHLFFQIGDLDRARDYLELALRHDPENFEAWNNMGSVLVAQGRPEDSLPFFRQSIALRVDPRTYCNLGDALLKLGRKEEARASFSEARKIDPAYGPAAAKLHQLDN